MALKCWAACKPTMPTHRVKNVLNHLGYKLNLLGEHREVWKATCLKDAVATACSQDVPQDWSGTKKHERKMICRTAQV